MRQKSNSTPASSETLFAIFLRLAPELLDLIGRRRACRVAGKDDALRMRVYGPNGTTIGTATSAARRQAGGTFTLTESEAPQPQTAAVALRALGGIDALIALQGIEEPAERRRRSVKYGYGRRELDALDELKLGLLSGSLDQTTLLRLKSAATDLKDGSGDEQLGQVLAEIDLRVAVELAKAGIG